VFIIVHDRSERQKPEAKVVWGILPPPLPAAGIGANTTRMCTAAGETNFVVRRILRYTGPPTTIVFSKLASEYGSFSVLKTTRFLRQHRAGCQLTFIVISLFSDPQASEKPRMLLLGVSQVTPRHRSPTTLISNSVAVFA